MNPTWLWLLSVIFITNGVQHDMFEREDCDPEPTAPSRDRRVMSPDTIALLQAAKDEALFPDQGRDHLFGIMMLRRMIKNDTGKTKMSEDLVQRIVGMVTTIPLHPLSELFQVLDGRLKSTNDQRFHIWLTVCTLH